MKIKSAQFFEAVRADSLSGYLSNEDAIMELKENFLYIQTRKRKIKLIIPTANIKYMEILDEEKDVQSQPAEPVKKRARSVKRIDKTT